MGGEERIVSVVSCRRCGRDMVPHLITGPPIFPGRNWRAIPIRSVCPFCAATYARLYSPMRDLCGRVVVGLVLMWLLAITVKLIAEVNLKEQARRHSGSSSLFPNSPPSAAPRQR